MSIIQAAPKASISKEIISNLQKPDIISIVKNINNAYLYWDKIKYKKTDKVTAEVLWSTVKFTRTINYKQINFAGVHFNYYNTDYIQKSLHEFDMNIGGNMGAKGIIPEQDKERYLVSSIMEEAISSSLIEGANTTRKKAKEMLRKETRPKNKSEQMIVNNYITINHILKHKNEDLTPENLLHIHQLMCNKTLETSAEEGSFRDSDDIYVVNHTNSEIVYTPPEHQKIEELINELCNFFNNDNNDFVHPIVKGIIMHFMIGWIHPFTDGNGRTARALFYWFLLKKGYWLTEYLSISKIIQGSKNQYEKAYLYTEHDDNDLSYFITYHLQVMYKAFESLKTYIQEKQKDNLKIAYFIKIPNINERQAQILKMLNDEPEIVFSVKEIENRFTVSNYTARADLIGLVEKGYLEVIPVNKVKQNYVRSKQFNKLVNIFS
jgi:Fic family protein